MPSLDSSRSTCLVACLVARPRAAARPCPIAETARDALCRTPRVALHRHSTRLACRSCSNTLPSTRCTASNENRLMSATWGVMTCSARLVGWLRGRLVKLGRGERGSAKLQCYCVIGAHPSLFGNPEAAGDSIIPTPASDQNEGIDKPRRGRGHDEALVSGRGVGNHGHGRKVQRTRQNTGACNKVRSRADAWVQDGPPPFQCIYQYRRNETHLGIRQTTRMCGEDIGFCCSALTESRRRACAIHDAASAWDEKPSASCMNSSRRVIR